jgi:hypothetical protein
MCPANPATALGLQSTALMGQVAELGQLGGRSNIEKYFMNNKYVIGNAILWAAAILASALVHAPVVLSSIILPALAVCSLVVILAKSKDSDCKK